MSKSTILAPAPLPTHEEIERYMQKGRRERALAFQAFWKSLFVASPKTDRGAEPGNVAHA